MTFSGLFIDGPTLPPDGSAGEEISAKGPLAFFDFDTIKAVCEATLI